MYQFGGINDVKVPGLASILNYSNDNFYSKDNPAINDNHYNITTKRYNEEIHNIYNINISLITLRIIDIQMNIVIINNNI